MLGFMARSRSRRSSPTRSTNGHRGNGLDHRLRTLVVNAPADRPLPTTRELGEKFGIANTTVFRVLRGMAEAGEIWQHPTNGRYYPPAARALLDRPKPVACLIRRLELGSELYRELLEGISAGCGERQRTMLLWHDERLVNHPDPQQPPVFASATQQRAILAEFLDRHGGSAGGFLLDHLWNDDALRSHLARLQPAVMLFRSCALPGISNIAVDFRAGALKALAHLLGRGFEHIIFVEPFGGDPAVTEFSADLVKAAAELDCSNRLSTATAATPKERTALIDRLNRSARRNALLCPEDTVALLLAAAAREAGLRLPERAGVLSVMGTDFAARAGLSCLRYDFRALGRMAVAALTNAGPVHQMLPPQFVGGQTT
jgi:DNA-binding LacI/PurR family transcriptional regulator